jgi:hypothetical protein
VTPLKRQVEDAKGSSERDAASLTLRSALGKTLTPDDKARQDYYGATLGRMPRVRIPGPLARASEQLDRVRPQTPNAGVSPQQPQVNVTPQVNVDETRVARACVEAITPVINRKMDDLVRGLRDQNHAMNVRGGI